MNFKQHLIEQDDNRLPMVLIDLDSDAITWNSRRIRSEETLRNIFFKHYKNPLPEFKLHEFEMVDTDELGYWTFGFRIVQSCDTDIVIPKFLGMLKQCPDIQIDFDIETVINDSFVRVRPPFDYGVTVKHKFIEIQSSNSFIKSSFNNIQKLLETETLFIGYNVLIENGIMNIFKIKGIRDIQFGANDDNVEIYKVIQRYIKDHDEVGCTNELIRLGFKDIL